MRKTFLVFLTILLIPVLVLGADQLFDDQDFMGYSLYNFTWANGSYFNGTYYGDGSQLTGVSGGSGTNYWQIDGDWMEPNTTAGGKNLINLTTLNATNFYQGGNDVCDDSDNCAYISDSAEGDLNVNDTDYLDGYDYTDFILDAGESDLNVNSSTYWGNENDQADLNVNNSNYLDGYDYTDFILDAGEGNLNVNSSTYWDDETSQANLNVNDSDYLDGYDYMDFILSVGEGDLDVNSSDYWDNYNTPADFTEGILADSIIVTADIKNGTITIGDLDATVYAKDIVTTSPIVGGENNVLVGADADLTLSLTACSDTEIYKYNSTSSAWECEADESGGSYTFNLTGDSGTVQVIASGNVVDIEGGTGIDTVVGATDTVTVTVDLSEFSVDTSLLGGDIIPFWEDQAGDEKKITWDNMQASINTLGTIGTGVWEGTEILDAYIADNITASNYILTSSEGDLNVNHSDTSGTATTWDGETSQADLNVNHSDTSGTATTWDGETSQGDLNVNGSTYWGNYNTASDLNNLITILWANVTAGWDLNVAWTNTLGGDNITDGTIDESELAADCVKASELDVSDVSDDIAGDIAEGELANDIIVEADLKCVNAAADEDIFTYESTTGDFEWHTKAELSIGDMNDLSDDSSPQLGGDLDTNGNTIGSATDEIDAIYIKDDTKVFYGNDQDICTLFNSSLAAWVLTNNC